MKVTAVLSCTVNVIVTVSLAWKLLPVVLLSYFPEIVNAPNEVAFAVPFHTMKLSAALLESSVANE